MTIWWPVNSFARDISEIFFKISQVLVLISFCSSTSALKIRHSLLLYAQAIFIILISYIATVISVQWPAGMSPCLAFSSLREDMMGKFSSILCNESVICIRALLQLCAEWHTSKTIISTDPTIFSIPAPSTCLKTSAVRTKIFYSSGKLLLSIEYFFLDCCSGFLTTVRNIQIRVSHHFDSHTELDMIYYPLPKADGYSARVVSISYLDSCKASLRVPYGIGYDILSTSPGWTGTVPEWLVSHI